MYFISFVVLTCVCLAGRAEESLSDLEAALAQQQSLLSKAQSRLQSAEASLKSNTEALTRAKLPQDQKTLRGYIAVSQSNVAKERSNMNTAQRQVDGLSLRIAEVRKAAAQPAANVKPEAATQVAAPAKAPTKLNVVKMKDGRTIECVRFMEVDGEYALQLPDKKLMNVKKADVESIDTP